MWARICGEKGIGRGGLVSADLSTQGVIKSDRTATNATFNCKDQGLMVAEQDKDNL